MLWGKEAHTRREARRAAKTGFGPFTPEVVRALYNRECMRCGSEISEYAFSRNGLVVEPRTVVVLCGPCRGVPGYPIAGVSAAYQGILDVDRIIVGLYNHTCSISGARLDWLEALACVRMNWVVFQSGLTDCSSGVFVKPQFLTTKRIPYGDLAAIDGCPECSHFWNKKYAGPKFGRSLEELDPSEYGDSMCGKCGTPHNMHWHTRTTEAEERALLFSRNP